MSAGSPWPGLPLPGGGAFPSNQCHVARQRGGVAGGGAGATGRPDPAPPRPSAFPVLRTAHPASIGRKSANALSATGQQLIVLHAGDERAIVAAFATLVEQHVGALIVGSDPLFRTQLVTLAAGQVPAIYPSREIPEAGGLMSYGVNTDDMYRQAGVYPDEF